MRSPIPPTDSPTISTTDSVRPTISSQFFEVELLPQSLLPVIRNGLGDISICRYLEHGLIPFQANDSTRNIETSTLYVGVLQFDSMALTVVDSQAENVQPLPFSHQKAEGRIEAAAM